MSVLDVVSEAEFAGRVLQSPKRVAVEFSGPNCGTCVLLEAALRDIATDYDGQIEFLKLDVSEATNLAANYAIRSVPTLLLFEAGNLKHRILGNQARSKLGQLLDAFVEGV